MALTGVEPKAKLVGHDIESVHDGGLIQFTYAIVEPMFPSVSLYIKVKLPFHVKVYVLLPPLFRIVVPFSENHVSVAITEPVVGEVVL